MASAPERQAAAAAAPDSQAMPEGYHAYARLAMVLAALIEPQLAHLPTAQRRAANQDDFVLGYIMGLVREQLRRASLDADCVAAEAMMRSLVMVLVDLREGSELAQRMALFTKRVLAQHPRAHAGIRAAVLDAADWAGPATAGVRARPRLFLEYAPAHLAP